MHLKNNKKVQFLHLEIWKDESFPQFGKLEKIGALDLERLEYPVRVKGKKWSKTTYKRYSGWIFFSFKGQNLTKFMK